MQFMLGVGIFLGTQLFEFRTCGMIHGC
jgi:hypothetical protein